MDQTLKVSQSLDNQKSLKSINSNHREEKSKEDLKDQRKIEIIGTNQIVISKKASINMMSQ